MISLKRQAMQFLDRIDVQIGGTRPWDIQVHDERVYRRVLLNGSLGLGESYMDGWWDCAQPDEFFFRIFSAQLDEEYGPIKMAARVLFSKVSSFILNRQTKEKAREVGERHYDIGNDLYATMLDTRMMYSCGYWRESVALGPAATTLDEAQERKLDLICKKLRLEPGMTVLDIGCGWGGFAQFAAERYGVRVTGVTISKEQAALAAERVRGLPVDIRLEDYRDTTGEFDRVVSIGMFEHVGYKNYRTFMRVVSKRLKHGGLFLLHTIGGNYSVVDTDPWIDTYIFPNGMLPSIAQIGTAAERLFVMEDWHNFGADYDTTLMAWQRNFDAHWPELKASYSERFRRMWNFYLFGSAAAFRARNNQLWQIVFTKRGLAGGYTAIR